MIKKFVSQKSITLLYTLAYIFNNKKKDIVSLSHNVIKKTHHINISIYKIHKKKPVDTYTYILKKQRQSITISLKKKHKNLYQ